MSKKILKSNRVQVNKKKIHAYKQPIAGNSVVINKIVVSDKFEHSGKGFKYFTVYKEVDIIRNLYMVLPQMSGYIKYFDNGGKNMSFKVDDDNVLVKYNEKRKRIKKIDATYKTS